jgi:hypothetical protein
MNLKLRRAILLAFSLILVASASRPLIYSVFAKPGAHAGEVPQDQEVDLQLEPQRTTFVNLPLIEENSARDPSGTPPGAVLISEQSQEVTTTPTPTPIPQQGASVNIPIVLGALAIILVVILAWFFVYYLPGRRSSP